MRITDIIGKLENAIETCNMAYSRMDILNDLYTAVYPLPCDSCRDFSLIPPDTLYCKKCGRKLPIAGVNNENT